jgi:hypothetical protein
MPNVPVAAVRASVGLAFLSVSGPAFRDGLGEPCTVELGLAPTDREAQVVGVVITPVEHIRSPIILPNNRNDAINCAV